MEYSHDDAGLLRQPIGYWSFATSKAVVTLIRRTLAEYGITQPQNWVLGQLNEGPKPRAEVISTLTGYLDEGDDGIAAAIAGLLDQGLVAEQPAGTAAAGAPEAVLALTEKGGEHFAVYSTALRATLDRIHEGVSDEEYLLTLKVLQRMIRNAGGEAWHH